MSLAYAVVFVDARFYDEQTRVAEGFAQEEADRKFEQIAQENRRTLITRNPEPRVMTYDEVKQSFPQVNAYAVVGLYFTADIT